MLSIVVPVFNEEESLDAFYTRVKKVLPKLAKKYEILFVDDGSIDASLSMLKEYAKKDRFVRVFSFRRNQGKAEALTYGFQKATGEIIVSLDADLQDQPEEIQKLIKKLNDGWDLVTAWRKNRKDAQKMKIISKIWNRVLYLLWGLQLHDYNAGLKAYKKETAKNLFLYGGLHRFIPLLAYQKGFMVAELAVDHAPRKYGKSKYGFSKIRDLPDMFTVIFLAYYGKRPSHFFGFFGGLFFTIGMIILVYLTGLHFLFHQSVGDRPLWSIGIFFALVGLQIGFTGFLADLILNISQNNRLQDLSSYPVKYSSDIR